MSLGTLYLSRMPHNLHNCIDSTAVTTYTIEPILGSAYDAISLAGAAFFRGIEDNGRRPKTIL